jgi:hypothetical protein
MLLEPVLMRLDRKCLAPVMPGCQWAGNKTNKVNATPAGKNDECEAVHSYTGEFVLAKESVVGLTHYQGIS